LFFQQTAVGPPPLPGGVAAVLRFLFNLPQWFQIVGFIVGILVAIAAVIYMWRRRAAIIAWIVTRPRGIRIGLVATAAVVLLFATGFGAVSWNYMQHDNGFCTGCHIMKDPFQRFTGSKHDSLSCHNCHQQSIFASTRQLYLWVADRPEKISMHAKVPTRICAECHVHGNKEKEKWKRIATTAGHRVHLESDSSALRDVQCTTCHGLEVHRFVPVNRTCGQSGCHENVEIKLGKMAQQTGFHCVACHQFTAEVPLLATRDSAAGTLRPGAHECLSCHEMRRIIETFDPARDPHNQICGMCHDPHVQTRPADALKSCASAGCHADWRAEPFHTGSQHKQVAARCSLCHQPHAASVDASDCSGCHTEVNRRSGGRYHLPAAFDTTKALQRTSLVPPEPEWKGKGDANPPRAAPIPTSQLHSPLDSFSHDRHKQLACLTCHTTSRGHGRLTFEAPRGCQICHHQAPATSKCATCHAANELMEAQPETVTVAVREHAARSRTVGFTHEAHAEVRCAQCHTAPVSLDPAAEVVTCKSCHEDHHQAERNCSVCHSVDVRAAHPDSLNTHAGCDACHREATVAALVPDRGLCLTCHEKQRDHYADRECTTCHLQATPDGYNAHLRKAGA
jgi:hypothetical protein